MDTTNFRSGVRYVLGVVALIVVLGFVVAATASCSRDVWVDAPRIEGEDASWEEDTYAPTPEEGDDVVADLGADAEEDDCGGPWGCKKYPLRINECETDADCGDGFVCDVPSTQCVPVEPGKHYVDAQSNETESDVTAEAEEDANNMVSPDVESEECHCGVGYVCDNGACIPVEQIPESDVVEDSSESVGDVVADAQNNGDVAEDSNEQEEDVVADAQNNDAADGSEANTEESPLDVAQGDNTEAESGVDVEVDVVESFAGAKCTITCPDGYENVRVWWAFTSADFSNGSLFTIPKAELCVWGQMAFEYNCFVPDGKWGDYIKAKIICTPADYELVDTGVHGRVEFGESCW